MGDWIELDPQTKRWAKIATPYALQKSCIPDFDITEIYCMHGPHDSDDFMTTKDRLMLYSTAWKIGHNSNRTGIRLVGPVPEWSRKDGGEGGSHPSNIFDYGYPSPGGINWGGDSAAIFSMDSPDLGGLLCSSTIVSADLWRLGQVKPGGHLKLRPTTFEHARELVHRVETFIEGIHDLVSGNPGKVPKLDLELPPSGLVEGTSNAIIRKITGNGECFQVVYRQVSRCLSHSDTFHADLARLVTAFF
jgi:urea carboxylase